MKVELSHVISIGAIIALLGGFYYTTQHRLDHLEEQVEILKRSVNKKQRKSK
tara:strand:- start:307 stop:462 length:156 start_codon:yes stop_codon:yes gene_type:complete